GESGGAVKRAYRVREHRSAMRLVTGDSGTDPSAATNPSPFTRRRLIAGLAALILLVFIVALLRAAFRPERESRVDELMLAPAVAPNAPTNVDAVTRAVNAFAAFTLEESATRGTEFNVAYVSDGLRLFATVVEAFMTRDSLVRGTHAAAPRRMRAEAERLVGGRGAGRPTTATLAAFISAAEAVAVVQRRKFPHLEQAISGLRDAARSIRPNRPLPEQRAEVEAFFLRASDAVQGMMTVPS
ncbi:MAG: hypothetical protein ACREOG_03565, partial [Gemmatimonadaceae bacterium]